MAFGSFPASGTTMLWPASSIRRRANWSACNSLRTSVPGMSSGQTSGLWDMRIRVQRQARVVGSHFSLTCLIPVFTLLALGCSGAKVTTQASSELPRYQVHTMALLPFSAMETPQVRDVTDQYMSTPRGARASDISVAIPSTVEAPIRQTVTVPPYAAEKITQLFWTKLRNRKDLTVLSPSDAVKAAPPVGVGIGQASPESAAAQAAKSLQADAALMGKVLVYQERV